MKKFVDGSLCRFVLVFVLELLERCEVSPTRLLELWDRKLGQVRLRVRVEYLVLAC